MSTLTHSQLFEVCSKYADDYRAFECGKSSVKPNMPSYLGTAIITIAEHLSNKSNFKNYSFKEEMIGDAIETCVQRVHNFDARRFNNAFSYIARICFHAFIKRIKKEKQEILEMALARCKGQQSCVTFNPNDARDYSNMLTEKIEKNEPTSPIDEYKLKRKLIQIQNYKLQITALGLSVYKFTKAIGEKNTFTRRDMMRKMNANRKKEQQDMDTLVQTYLDLGVKNGLLDAKQTGRGAAQTTTYSFTEKGRKHVEQLINVSEEELILRLAACRIEIDCLEAECELLRKDLYHACIDITDPDVDDFIALNG
jgi:hypothetical protein